MYIGPGTLIENRYLIKREIGQGGIGVIYLAYHVPLKKDVVVKKAARGTKKDFRSEVDILKNLHFRGIPQVYDFLEIDGYVYTVMEYVEGHDLSYYIKRNVRVSEAILLEWLEKLTEILDYIHTLETPYYHSDIKPENIMITTKGEPFLIDFNISLRAGESRVKGLSPYYSAPEQYEQAEHISMYHDDGGITVDQRMDIYSLGASFYTIMSGRMPEINGGNRISLTEMELPYSMAFRALIDKAIQVDPAKRFQSASAMLKAVRNVVVMDPEYHRLTVLQLFLAAPLAFFLILGIIFILHGNSLIKMEKYNSAWSEYVLRYQKNDYDNALDKGYELLRNTDMSRLLDDDPERKMELLHSIGDIYFDKEMYSAAAEYYRDAAQLSSNAEFYRDLAVASARSGEVDAAYMALDSAMYNGLDKMTEQYIKAEILAIENKYGEAISVLTAVRNSTFDSDLRTRSGILLARMYQNNNDTTASADVLRSIISESESRTAYRMLAKLDMDLADAGGRIDRENSFLREACNCYEHLYNMYNPTYEDQINFALCLRYLGQYTRSNTVLDDLLSIYSRDSRAEMWKCYNLLNLKSVSRENDAELIELYEQLKYDFIVNGSEDMREDMETLGRIIGR